MRVCVRSQSVNLSHSPVSDLITIIILRLALFPVHGEINYLKIEGCLSEN